ncbi:hypothetical protein ACIBF5_25655 [Micromonospora sp. NPDC050417]|uniref:hypothetical protein n=1 Tax=Micromonospora sp. NPDC050417 TaxID=3364280 RepID=UPI0037B3C963
MDRRVAALFGAIIAVGLGPAVWLGGTLLRTEPAPPGPTPSGSAEPTPTPTPTADPPTPDPSVTGSLLPPEPNRFPGRNDPGVRPLTPTPTGSRPASAGSPSPSTSPPAPPATPPPSPTTAPPPLSPSPEPTVGEPVR